MKTVATMALKSGMVLARDVYSYQNILISKEGDIVDSKLIAKLSRYSIMCVEVKESSDFAVTDYHRIHSSQAFQNFENIYRTNLNAFKYMMDSFLENNSTLNLSYLLSIHDNVKTCCKNDKELLDFLYHLILKKEDLVYSHLLNAALISSILGKYIGLNSKDSKLLILCGFLYDIGKIKLPVHLLFKSTKLTEAEQKMIQNHTQIGYDLLRNQNINDKIIQCTLNHHEKPDGTGYPNGLHAESIDLFSKYISIVDRCETMTFVTDDKQSLNPAQILDYFEKMNKIPI